LDWRAEIVPTKDSASIRLLQLSDTHFGEVSGERLLGLDPEESLSDVLACVRANESGFDHLVLSGDVATEGCPASYQRVLKLLARDLPLPMHWLPGNHDGPVDMLAARPTSRESVFELGDWLCIMLDSKAPGEVSGRLAEEELNMLEDALVRHPGRPTLVFLHHHPVCLGSGWLDGNMLQNPEALFAILTRFEQVKALSWGHVHQEYRGDYEGIQLIASPSTCIQFAPRIDAFTLDRQMPGYRWYELHSDGRFDTGVVRVPNKSYGIDFDSQGY
jgi:Icc protein